MSNKEISKIICPLCEEEVSPSDTSEHHIVPRSKGGKEKEPVCNPCHSQIHALFTNKELAEMETLGTLLDQESIKTYIKWRKKHPNEYSITTKKSTRAKKQGKYK